MGTVSSSPRSKSVKIAPKSRGGILHRLSFRRRSHESFSSYKRASNGSGVIPEENTPVAEDGPIERFHATANVKDDVSSLQDKEGSDLSLSRNDAHKRKRSWRGRKSTMKADVPIQIAAIDEDAFVSTHDLHNILNDGALSPFIHDPGNILLIDARDKHKFQKHHIVTAKHVASFSDQQIASGYGLAQYMVCVIYGSETCNNNYGPVDVVNLREKLVHVISGDVYILRESYDTFNTQYSFLCTEKIVDTAWERKALITYPSVIIDDKLYQGRGDQATNDHVITNLKITHIVNISTEHANRFERKVIYLRVQIEDVSSANIVKYFEETSEFIQSAIGSGGRVLVHCNLGVSRSSAVNLAFLMKYNQWPLDRAYEYLKGRRSCAYPNRGFLKQLSDWEAIVLGERRTNIDYL